MKVAALVDDLFFTSKISAIARQSGSDVVFCRSAEDVTPDSVRIFVDLNATTFDAVAEIAKLKATHKAPLIAYFSHVQVDLRRRAEEAGADQVLARSAFVEQLPSLTRS
jgi:CheY-like chemotaxis protein